MEFNCDKSCRFDSDRTREHLLWHIRQKIPTRLDASLLDLLPRRQDFLDPNVTNYFSDKILKGRPVLFMPTDIQERTTVLSGEKYERSVIYMFGILPCGSKTCVILDDVPIYFDVEVKGSDEQFRAGIITELRDANIRFKSTEFVKQFKFHGFSREPVSWVRIYFDTLYARRQAILLMQKKHETANDDLGASPSYFNVIARRFKFNTAGWNRIENYTQMSATLVNNCKYVLRASITAVKKLRDKDRSKYEENPKLSWLPPLLDKDRTVLCQWDIETYKEIQDGRVPTPDDQDFNIFMISSVYYFSYSNEHLLRVCCVDVDVEAYQDIDLMIVCGDEKTVLRAHAEMLVRMAPDILAAYNGGNFDWPLYREKLRRYGMLKDVLSRISALPLREREREDKWLLNYMFANSREIKISAERKHTMACYAIVPGMLDIDVQPIMKQAYPRAEIGNRASLNYFLKLNGLEPKDDMPYKRMFRFYERAKKLLTAPRECHCDVRCSLCDDHVRELDYNNVDGVYKLREVVQTKCCACVKRPETMDGMAKVAHYCVIDCIRPQQLLVKRSVISDRRELSNASYVSLADSFYRADGMKVINLAGSYCHKFNVAFSNKRVSRRDCERNHYPGAWIFHPIRGLHSDNFLDITLPDGTKKRVRARPIVGLDFNSLYPSIMMAYNLSPDMVVKDPEMARQLEADGYKLHYVEFEYEQGAKKGAPDNKKLVCRGWCVRHNGVHNPFKSNLTIDHYDENRNPVYGREALPGERMGIFPFVVKKLFDKRVPIKKLVNQYKIQMEEMERRGETDTDEYRELRFRHDKIDAKQKAIKVLANTFYGKSGEFNSPLYELVVAGGVTTAGRYNIKNVAEFVSKKGFIVNYGDTDSLYLSCPAEVFAECDARYEAAVAALDKDDPDYQNKFVSERIKWWTEQVEISMKEIDKLNVQVSEFLLRDNGTTFLNMAYEEVGFPTVMCGKKKYFMTPHIKKVNFYPKEPFIRGIDIIKQGHAEITRKIGEEYIRKILAPENFRDPLELAEEKIRDLANVSLDPNLFKLYATYKPEKKNIPVHRFVERMKEMSKAYSHDPEMAAMYEPPEPGDKFEYIIVKREQAYALNGNKINLGKGDIMEYLHIYLKSQSTPSPMEIDLDYYMKGSIIGVFARFVASHERFQPPPGMFDPADPEYYDKIDSYCVSEAAKYLTSLWESISGKNREAVRQLGREYRKIYNRATKALKSDAFGRFGNSAALLYDLEEPVADRGGRAAESSTAEISTASIVEQIKHKAEHDVNVEQYGRRMLRRLGGDVFSLKRTLITRGVLKVREDVYARQEADVLSKLREVAWPFYQALKSYDIRFKELIEQLRREKKVEPGADEIETVNCLTEEEREIIQQVNTLYKRLVAIYSARAKTRDLARAITEKCTGSSVDYDELYRLARECLKNIPVLPEYKWA